MRKIFTKLFYFIAYLSIIAFILRSNYPSVAYFLGFPATISGFATVSDGDSLEIKNQRIRLVGIDAPELFQTCQLFHDDSNQLYNCGEAAKRTLLLLIKNRYVHCFAQGYDIYHRMLANCFSGTEDLNKKMVEMGWAVSFGSYADQEHLAKQKKLGLWSYGPFLYPKLWRKKHPKQ